MVSHEGFNINYCLDTLASDNLPLALSGWDACHACIFSSRSGNVELLFLSHYVLFGALESIMQK